jgi:putative ABC transport system permease protein
MGAFRYAWRQLRRSPGFTAVAVGTLALGIAANTAFFSIVNALILKPVPGVSFDGVSVIAKRIASLSSAEVRGLERDRAEGLAAVAAVSSPYPMKIQTRGRLEVVQAEFVTGGFAHVLNLPAQHGRWIRPEDDGDPSGEAVAVVSDRIWRHWFGAGDVTTGRFQLRIRLQLGRLNRTTTFTVIGVARPEFNGVRGRFERRDLWLPSAAFAKFVPDAKDRQQWLRFEHLTALARLDAGVAPEGLAGRLTQRLADSSPKRPGAMDSVRVIDAATAFRRGSLLDISYAILGLSSLVLIAACANLTNMIVARGATRAAEMAVRLSLGASRGHLIRLLFAEVSLIAIVAAGIGLGLALAAIRLFTDAFPYLLAGRYAGFTLDLSPDVRVIAFAFATGGLAAIAVGGMTAWRAARSPLLQVLAGSGAPAGITPRSQRLRTAMVGVQVTVAVVLVMVAGLGWEEMRKTLDRADMYGRRVGYDTRPLTSVQINLADHGYEDARAQAALLRLADDVRRIPGVEGVALADALPGTAKTRWTAQMTMFAARDSAGNPSTTHLVNGSFARVSPGLQKTIDLKLLRGRDIAASDGPGATKVAVVGARTAARLWPGEDPIGKEMVFGVKDWLTVVGVCEDPITADGNAPLMQSHFVFVSWQQYYKASIPMRVVIRSRAPDGHLEAARAAVRAIDEEVAVLDASWVEDSTLAWVKPQQAAALLMTSIGALALGISMLGVYGVIAYFVSVRSREFGIRLALGSTRRAVVKRVLDQAIHLTLIGLLAGVFIVAIASRFIQSRQLDFMPNEIETWVAVPLLIFAAGVIAGLFPAMRAARVSPNAALKDL